MPKAYVVRLTGDERQELERKVRSGRAAARVLARGRALLRCDGGLTD